VTTLQRIFKRNILLMCGNFDGVVSYAVGKGDNFKLAYENAIKQLRKNFIVFPLDHNMPVTK